jgi:hypothetical protein
MSDLKSKRRSLSHTWNRCNATKVQYHWWFGIELVRVGRWWAWRNCVNGKVKVDKQLVYFHIATVVVLSKRQSSQLFKLAMLGFDSRKNWCIVFFGQDVTKLFLSMCIRWPCQLRNITLTYSISITVDLINKRRYMHTFYWANWWCICSFKHICCFQCFKFMVKVLANLDFLTMFYPTNVF